MRLTHKTTKGTLSHDAGEGGANDSAGADDFPCSAFLAFAAALSFSDCLSRRPPFVPMYTRPGGTADDYGVFA